MFNNSQIKTLEKLYTKQKELYHWNGSFGDMIKPLVAKQQSIQDKKRFLNYRFFMSEISLYSILNLVISIDKKHHFEYKRVKGDINRGCFFNIETGSVLFNTKIGVSHKTPQYESVFVWSNKMFLDKNFKRISISKKTHHNTRRIKK